MIAEIPINTLDSQELLIQFKLMKSLGYQSLWNADFQRELKNPLRRLIYYRLIAMEDAQKARYQIELLKSIANRISYFSDPELFKKVTDIEEQHALDSMPEDDRLRMESRHLQAIRQHPQMSEEDLEKVRALLNN